jgi:hypothetical protein
MKDRDIIDFEKCWKRGTDRFYNREELKRVGSLDLET